MSISKASSHEVTFDPDGDAMRMWRNEQPQQKAPHRSASETLGYAIAGKAELTIEGHSVTLKPGDSWLVPDNAGRSYTILEAFTAVECSSPAQR